MKSVKKTLVSKIFVLAILCCISIVPNLSAEDVAAILKWVNSTEGPTDHNDRELAITSDLAGNVLVTGKENRSGSGYDYVTIKYDPEGNELWKKFYNGPSNADDGATAIDVDPTGNIYVTGKSTGLGSGFDYLTIKYDINGNVIWTARYNGAGTGNDVATKLKLDSNGNVYVSGYSMGEVSGYDYLTIKYNSDGDELWINSYNGLANLDDEVTAMAIGQGGYIYITGKSTGIGTDYDYLTIKYDEFGNQLWTARYNGILNDKDIPVSVAENIYGDVYVAGTGRIRGGCGGVNDYVTIKYDSLGNQVWMAFYNDDFGDGNDTLRDMAIDSNDNVYVTGSSWRYAWGHDYVTIKYDANGNQLWRSIFHGPGGDDYGVAIELDSNNNVIVTGCSHDAYPLYMKLGTIKYDNDGIQIWKTRYTDIDYIIPVDMVLTQNDEICITGRSKNYITPTNWGYVTLKYGEGPFNQAPIADAGEEQTVYVGTLVTLDGNNSYDPDVNYPLNYAWEILSKPESSAAELKDPASLNPTFIADLIGDYTIRLIVTDSLGLSSIPDKVIVSTVNSAPIADAGLDQAVIEIGTTVQLDGSLSWDPDGDPLAFEWSFASKPAGSETSLSATDVCNPSFVADKNGEYVIELLVSDPWASSAPDLVIVSFDNVKPVADAGLNQSVIQGDTVHLDGIESYDANLDQLTYSWSIVVKPTNSLAEIDSPTSVHPQFVADLPGEYIVSLIVNDGIVDSDPSNITITALSHQDATTEALQELMNAINSLDGGVFKNPKNQNALTNKVNAVLAKIEIGLYQDALDKLENDISAKTNGCAETGSPDKNDWIENCVSQSLVYPLVIDAINLLNNLV